MYDQKSQVEGVAEVHLRRAKSTKALLFAQKSRGSWKRCRAAERESLVERLSLLWTKAACRKQRGLCPLSLASDMPVNAYALLALLNYNVSYGSGKALCSAFSRL